MVIKSINIFKANTRCDNRRIKIFLLNVKDKMQDRRGSLCFCYLILLSQHSCYGMVRTLPAGNIHDKGER